jgi:hypothetical protein
MIRKFVIVFALIGKIRYNRKDLEKIEKGG